jgi:hypothetical protein
LRVPLNRAGTLHRSTAEEQSFGNELTESIQEPLSGLMAGWPLCTAFGQLLASHLRADLLYLVSPANRR